MSYFVDVTKPFLMDQFEKVFKVRHWKFSTSNLAERTGMPEPEFKALRKKILKKEFEIIKDNKEVLMETIRESLYGSDPDATITLKPEDRTAPSPTTDDPVISLDKSENIEDGTLKYDAIATVEPRSPEEIIRLLKIDETQWKLKMYWVKSKRAGYHISALVTRRSSQEKNLLDLNKILSGLRIKPAKPPKDYSRIIKTDRKVCAVLSLQDIHFGKEGNEDIGSVVLKAVREISQHLNMYDVEELKLILGSDTLNMDTFGGTTTSGTPVDNHQRAVDAYLSAFKTLIEVIQLLRLECQKLQVVFIPGNHDRLSSFHLIHAMEQYFSGWTKLEFDSSYAERKVFTYGKNFLAFEHGDKKTKNNPMVFAVEFPELWGSTYYRYLFIGHTHGRKTREVETENEQHGFITKTISALTASDYYHHTNKFVGNHRATQLQIHDKESGFLAEFNFNLTTTNR